ncbi:MAG: MBG domain-containing protein [Subdoligranulum sp.]|nr:MBG domain-containing protein [Subdoligranulum sp.]
MISTALACGLVTNAFAATGTAKAAAPVPAITLTADKNTVSVGDTITISMAVDGTKNGFAVLQAFLNYNADAFSPSAVTSIDNTTAKGFGVTKPTVSTTGLSALILRNDENIKAAFDSAATYTFKATQAGTFDFSVSGGVSAVGYTATPLDKAFKISVTVSAKPLTATPVQNTTLSAEYGRTMGELADSIQPKDFVLKSGNTDVTGKVDGKWSAEDPNAIPAAGTASAKFLFTPKNSKEYNPAEATFALDITPKTVTPTLSVEPAEKMYDGGIDLTADQKAAITLDGVIPADKGKVSADFSSIAYDKADSGERTITASGIALTGDQKDNYKLSAVPCTAKGSITPYTGEVSVQENFTTRSYTGAAQPLQKGELVLTANGQTLQPDTDYTITYPHGCTGTENADTEISYTLTGKGNYAGCTFTGSTGKFTILARPLPTVKTGSSLGDPITAVYRQEYTLPTVSNDILNDTDAQGTLSLRYKQGSGEWSNIVPTEPGKYTIGVYFESSTDKYSSGMLNGISTTLTIQKAEGSGKVSINQSYVYGEAITPEAQNGTGDVSYTYTGRDNTNYAESAAAPTNVGSYTVTATFAESDTHKACTATADFSITPKSIVAEDFTLSATEFTYNSSEQKPAVLAAEGRKMAEGTDYTVKYPDASTIAGPYTVTVTGKGNYTDSVTYSYTIKQANGSGSVTMADYTYGDKAPAPVATSATNGTAGVSYTYESRDGTTYAKNETAPTNAGSYTVTASFKESTNATACTATANFTVHPKGLVANDFALSDTEFTYNGSEQKPTVSPVTEGTDYTVKHPDKSTNAGSYTVKVTGQGNYTGTVELSYKINPAVYKLPEGAKITTELETYPLSIYGGQPLSHIGLKATGLPEGAQFGWKAGGTKLATSAGDPVSYDVTVNPNSPNYSAGTTTVSVTLAKAIAPAADEKGITNQLSTVAASISKTASENGKLSAGAAKDIAQLTLSGNLTPKEQDDLKSAHLSDTALLDALDKSAKNVTVSTQLKKGEKSALTDLAITTGGKAALGADNDTTAYTATYTAMDITPEKPADGQLIEVELSLGSGQQPAVPVLVRLSFHAKNADPNGKFQVVHKHTEADASKNFTTQYDCRSVSKSGDTVTVQFLAASFSSFSIQYTAPASGGSSSPSATPKPDEPQPQPTATPAPTASETTWLGGYGALLNAKSGTALSLDVTACEYLPGYIITGVQKSGVTLNLSTPAGKLCLSPAVAKAMNGSYNYTFADALAIAGKVAAAAKPAASPAPVKDPTAASPTPAPTPVPTAAPQPTQAPAPQPEAEPQEKSHSPLPMVAAVLVAAALLAGGYLAYNSASRRKALHDVYAPSKKVKLNQNQNNGRNRE